MTEKQIQQLISINAKRFVKLGDDPGVFMTCESGKDVKPCVRLQCQDLQHAQSVHTAIIDLVKATRVLMDLGE